VHAIILALCNIFISATCWTFLCTVWDHQFLSCLYHIYTESFVMMKVFIITKTSWVCKVILTLYHIRILRTMNVNMTQEALTGQQISGHRWLISSSIGRIILRNNRIWSKYGESIVIWDDAYPWKPNWLLVRGQ
jgi:hypothetical protein